MTLLKVGGISIVGGVSYLSKIAQEWRDGNVAIRFRLVLVITVTIVSLRGHSSVCGNLNE
jgi:hypothetical protein